MGFGGNSGSGSSRISESGDVAFNNLSGNDLFIYDTATGKWKNNRGIFMARRVWNGTSYPARISGTTNIFIGDTNPGGSMDAAQDLWANPNLTTLDTVATAATTQGSALNQGIKEVLGSTSVFIGSTELAKFDSDVTFSLLDTTYVPVLSLPPSYNRSLRAVITIPAGWNTMRFDVFWTHSSSSHTNTIRWNASVTVLDLTEQIPTSSTSSTSYTAAVNGVDPAKLWSTTLPTTLSVNPAGGLVSVAISRVGASSEDTFSNPISVLGIRLRKAS